MVAATVGGEIVAIPFAFYHMGIYFSAAFVILVATLSHLANMMSLRVKDFTPCQFESIYEISYLLGGKCAIYMVCIVQYFLNFFSIVLYYMIIGDTAAQIFEHFFVNMTSSKTHRLSLSSLIKEPVWI